MLMVKQWLRTMVARPNLKVLLVRAWGSRRMQTCLASSSRTQWVRTPGPTTALISTVRDLGWNMPRPFAFETPGGTIHEMHHAEVDTLITEVAQAAENT